MSMTTTVAHLGVLRVRWISMSSGARRMGSPPPVRIMVLMSEPGMSMCAGESPNSYSLVRGSSTAPSPAIGPS
jgi:hypothetical protein